jgi:hypothetical protein
MGRPKSRMGMDADASGELVEKGRRRRVDVPNLKKKKKHLSIRVCSNSRKEKKETHHGLHRYLLRGTTINVNDVATGGIRGTEWDGDR